MELSHKKSLRIFLDFRLGQINLRMNKKNHMSKNLFWPCSAQINGNNYHTIFFCKSGMIYGWCVFDRKDYPTTMESPEFDTVINVNMSGLMILLTIYL